MNADLGLGFGLAMQDEVVGAPYFYLSAYRENGEINYQNLLQDEEWRWTINEDWQGAVLALDDFAATPAPSIQEAVNSKSDLLHRFIQKATAWFLTDRKLEMAKG